MLATTYPNAEQFLQTTQTFLEANEAANSLMLGICLQLKHYPDRVRTTPYFVTVAAGDALILAAVMTPPHNLVISGPDNVNQACDVLAKKLLSDGVCPPGVMGPASISETFASAWAKATRISYQPGMRLRIYQLRQVTPPPSPVSGHIRLATHDDVELVTRWALNFQEEALPARDPGQTREAIVQRIKEKEIYLWDNDGPVSMAAKARPIASGITVNLVYTPPALRRHGYASACVAAVSQTLLDSGWQFCVLFTDLSNPTSNRIYQAIGYRPVCDSNEYIFDVKKNYLS